MIKPDLPENEIARLHTLHAIDILDTPHEERFDRIVRLARRLFDVPIAMVSLVDEKRQWFKSKSGLKATETSRDSSFCAHAILKDSVFVVPNALKDERFFDNPLVVDDPQIRFYAGYPLTVNGATLGTLCILDHKPRNFSDAELDGLKDLAAITEHELAAHHLATVDELTHISNRRGFMMLAKNSLELCRVNNLPATLVYFDLNKFKFINDNFGHSEGDRALIKFAQILTEECRKSDILGRLGGDEFALFFTNANKAYVEHIINRIKESLTRHNQTSNHGYQILFSTGIIEFDSSIHSSLGSFIKAADALMYQDKQTKN